MKNMSLNVINDDYLSIENDTLYLNPKRKKKSFSNDYFLLPNKIFSEETNRRMIQIIAKNPTNQIQKQKQNKLKLKALSPRRIPEEEIIKKRKGHILILPLNKNNINPLQKEEIQKKMLLERFQEENHGFDFSDAEINGMVPDPKTFMGGLKYS